MNKCKGILKKQCESCEQHDDSINQIDIFCKKLNVMEQIKKINRDDKLIKRKKSVTSFNINNCSLNFRDLYYDFCYGLRLISKQNQYHIKMIDNDSENVYFDEIIYPKKEYSSIIKYYMNWRLEVYDLNDNLLFTDKLDLRNKKIAFISGSALGDKLAWIHSVKRFVDLHQCNADYYVDKNCYRAFKHSYSDYFNIIELKNNTFNNDGYYAVYYVMGGDMFGKSSLFPLNGYSPLHYYADYLLGMTYHDENILPLKSMNDIDERLKNKKYVCYSTQASYKQKQWHNEHGWEEVIKYLQSIGYTVVNLDVEKITDYKDVIYLNGKELDIQDRVDVLNRADFFIGISSGMSWVAHSCNIPVIMISGFSLPYDDFNNPYRVYSNKGCYGCWNIRMKDGSLYDTEEKKDNDCILNGEKIFQCSKNITPILVINTIKRLMKDFNLV